MNYKIEKIDDETIIKLIGEVDLYNVGELKKMMFEVIKNDTNPRLIIEMKGVDYMDSSGIGALVACHKKMNAKKGIMIIRNMKDDVLNILRLATLDKFFNIEE